MSGPKIIASWAPRPQVTQQNNQRPVAQAQTPSLQNNTRSFDAYAVRQPRDQVMTTASESPNEQGSLPSGRPSPNTPAVRSPAMGRPMELSADEDRAVRSRLHELEINEERFLARPRVLADMFDDAKPLNESARRPGNGQGLLPSPVITDKKQ